MKIGIVYRLYTCKNQSISVRLWPQETASLVSVSFTQEGSAMCCGTNSAKHFSLFMTMRLSHWPSLTTGRSTSRLISIFITYNISGRLVSIATTRGNVSQTNAIELLYCMSSMRPQYNKQYGTVNFSAIYFSVILLVLETYFLKKIFNG